uniref:Uncharacterized protein n=1 Tax=Catharus ustulatus TaxID=91951 RepID=A0A8C3V8E2_CATUS
RAEMNPSLSPYPSPIPINPLPLSPQKIQQLSEGSMFGHGLKHLFHSRAPDSGARSPEMHRVSYAVSLHDLPARPTAFNRVLQQIRARPSIKRGTSLHGGGRRAKSGSLEPQRGSPHLGRRAPQDSGLTAVLHQHQHQGRPRSSSTTDTAILGEGGVKGGVKGGVEGLERGWRVGEGVKGLKEPLEGLKEGWRG